MSKKRTNYSHSCKKFLVFSIAFRILPVFDIDAVLPYSPAFRILCCTNLCHGAFLLKKLKMILGNQKILKTGSVASLHVDCRYFASFILDKQRIDSSQDDFWIKCGFIVDHAEHQSTPGSSKSKYGYSS